MYGYSIGKRQKLLREPHRCELAETFVNLDADGGRTQRSSGKECRAASRERIENVCRRSGICPKELRDCTERFLIWMKQGTRVLPFEDITDCADWRRRSSLREKIRGLLLRPREVAESPVLFDKCH